MWDYSKGSRAAGSLGYRQGHGRVNDGRYHLRVCGPGTELQGMSIKASFLVGVEAARVAPRQVVDARPHNVKLRSTIPCLCGCASLGPSNTLLVLTSA